jgi:hypothetical protein
VTGGIGSGSAGIAINAVPLDGEAASRTPPIATLSAAPSGRLLGDTARR